MTDTDVVEEPIVYVLYHMSSETPVIILQTVMCHTPVDRNHI